MAVRYFLRTSLINWECFFSCAGEVVEWPTDHYLSGLRGPVKIYPPRCQEMNNSAPCIISGGLCSFNVDANLTFLSYAKLFLK